MAPRFQREMASEIIPGKLWLGAEWDAFEVQSRNPLGITHVLNVAHKPILGRGTLDSGVVVEWVPMSDDGTDDVFGRGESEDLAPASGTQRRRGAWWTCRSFLETTLACSRSRVLVHCEIGVNRSVTIVCAWLMECRRWSLQQAFDFMEVQRPLICPEPRHMEQLEDFEQSLARRPFPSESPTASFRPPLAVLPANTFGWTDGTPRLLKPRTALEALQVRKVAPASPLVSPSASPRSLRVQSITGPPSASSVPRPRTPEISATPVDAVHRLGRRRPSESPPPSAQSEPQQLHRSLRSSRAYPATVSTLQDPRGFETTVGCRRVDASTWRRLDASGVVTPMFEVSSKLQGSPATTFRASAAVAPARSLSPSGCASTVVPMPPDSARRGIGAHQHMSCRSDALLLPGAFSMQALNLKARPALPWNAARPFGTLPAVH